MLAPLAGACSRIVTGAILSPLPVRFVPSHVTFFIMTLYSGDPDAAGQLSYSMAYGVYDNDEKIKLHFPTLLGLEGVTFSKRSPAHGRSLHGMEMARELQVWLPQS
jgi:hypothetical protein